MTATKRENLTRWLIGFIWSVSLVGGTALFAVGSSVALTAGPWLWQRLRSGLNSRHQDTGTRVAGLLLCGVAGWALWMDLQPRIAEWCA